MNEEPTEINIEQLLSALPTCDLSPLERVVLANDGTVQTLLSVIFHVPIKVEVISQCEYFNWIVRWVKLVAEYSEDNKVTVCLAESVIPNNNPQGFLTAIREKDMGIGQIINSLKIDTKRNITGFYADDTTFARTYTITDARSYVEDGQPPLSVLITEVFQREAFKKAQRMGSQDD